MKLLFAVVLLVAISAQAKPGAEERLQKTAAEFQAYKKKSQNVQEREREVLSTMYKLNRRQRRLAIKKSEQLQKREELESDIAHLQSNIESVSSQIKQLKKQLIVRIKNLHRINAPTIFQTIFGSQDITEMDRNARILYKISKSDVAQLRTFRGLKNLLDQQQLNLEKKLADFEKNQKNLEEQEKAIKITYQAQMNLLQKLDDEDKALIAKIRKIKNKANRFDSQDQVHLETLFETGLYEKKGTLDMPVTGVITHKFGLLPLLQEKIKVYNKGWFISTAPGRHVTSVFRGRVAHVGVMGDYNQIVVLDHGDHFYTVYANLDSVNVSKGDELESQQMLGRVNQSRWFGHGLYFEVRHFSQSEDPAEWFKDSGFNLSSVKESSL